MSILPYFKVNSNKCFASSYWLRILIIEIKYFVAIVSDKYHEIDSEFP